MCRDEATCSSREELNGMTAEKTCSALGVWEHGIAVVERGQRSQTWTCWQLAPGSMKEKPQVIDRCMGSARGSFLG